MSSYALVKQQPFTCVPWWKRWISINARSSSPSDFWLEPDKPLSANFSLLLAFARWEELSMLRHRRRRAYRAPCRTHWERGGGLTAPGSRRGGCSEEENYLRTAVGFNLSGQHHQVAADWVAVCVEEHIKSWRLLLMGVFGIKTLEER